MPGVVFARDRVLELPHPTTERTTHLGQPLRAKNEKRDDKDND